MEDHHHHLLQSFTTTTTAGASDEDDDTITTLSTSRIVSRLVSVFFIAIISIWANYEASKGFDVTIINDAGDTPAGRRFDLLFVSNEKATRIVLNTSEFAEKILYPNDHHHPKKQVDRVTIKLTGRNLTHEVVVNRSGKHDFVLQISPSVMKKTNVEKAMVSAVQRGMARVWLWDGDGAAPESLLDGMVEYISMSAGFATLSDSGKAQLPESDNNCWKYKDPVAVAHFLNYCEKLRNGFVGRLNQAMKDPWHERMVDDAFGLAGQRICASYYSSTLQLSNILGPTSLLSVSKVS